MADVIIVLGNTFKNKKTIESMKLRTEKAAQLYKKGRVKKVIFSGGFKTRKDLSEAKFMADIAVKKGIPKKSIILEEKSNTTIGNAYYCNKIMKNKRFKSAIIITSPDHMRRAKYIFSNVLKNKKFVFEKAKNNLGFFEAILYIIDEVCSLIKLKIKGIDFSRI